MGATPPSRFDLVVVGSGIVGLAHAVVALERGFTVAVVERDRALNGASIRNFGHACATAQSGIALDRAMRSRARWQRVAAEAGFWAERTGTVVVARASDELAVLEEFADLRGDEVELLTADGLRHHVPTEAPDVIGGALFPNDLRVNPREAAPAIAAWLEGRDAVSMLRGVNCSSVEPGAVRTTEGVIAADRIVVSTNHDIDRFFPEIAAEASVTRCRLQMLRVRTPRPIRIRPGVLSGFSILRYSGFAECPGIEALRTRLSGAHPEAIDADLNLMMTQLPDGDLILGDTHARASVADPFSSEEWDDLLLEHGARLLGVDSLEVRQRWQGVYASAPEEFLVAEPLEGVQAVSVTTGIGMTTAFGLAEDVVAAW